MDVVILVVYYNHLNISDTSGGNKTHVSEATHENTTNSNNNGVINKKTVVPVLAVNSGGGKHVKVSFIVATLVIRVGLDIWQYNLLYYTYNKKPL